jgi:hypothetical protein
VLAIDGVANIRSAGIGLRGFERGCCKQTHGQGKGCGFVVKYNSCPSTYASHKEQLKPTAWFWVLVLLA